MTETEYDANQHVKDLRSLVSEWESDPDKIAKYLRWSSLFTDYSPFNKLMIYAQDPTATQVATANKWRSLGRYVTKGETHRIRVFRTYNRRWNEENENGDEVTRSYIGYNSFAVFDISQTNGDDLPENVSNPVLESEGIERIDKLSSMIASYEGITLTSKLMEPSIGWMVQSVEEKQVLVNSSHSPARQSMTRFNYVASGLYLDHISDGKFTDREAGWIGSAATWMVCQRNGFHIDEYTADLLGMSEGVDPSNLAVRITQSTKLANMLEALEEGVPVEWAAQFASTS